MNSDVAELLASLEVGTTLVTVAPECVPKGLIRQLTDHGVCIAIGHSNATYEEVSIALTEKAMVVRTKVRLASRGACVDRLLARRSFVSAETLQ